MYLQNEKNTDHKRETAKNKRKNVDLRFSELLKFRFEKQFWRLVFMYQLFSFDLYSIIHIESIHKSYNPKRKMLFDKFAQKDKKHTLYLIFK